MEAARMDILIVTAMLGVLVAFSWNLYGVPKQRSTWIRCVSFHFLIAAVWLWSAFVLR